MEIDGEGRWGVKRGAESELLNDEREEQERDLQQGASTSHQRALLL